MVVLYYHKQCGARIFASLLRAGKSQLQPVITSDFTKTAYGIWPGI
jgi:hypothetical protein